MQPESLLSTDCPNLKLVARGKVRDIYEIDSGHLLFVATDRLSAFDVVMRNGIPGKGVILTRLSLFWFDLLKDTVPNHLVTAELSQMPRAVQAYRDQLEGRSMMVRKLRILPIESIVRGYIAGSGWKEYQKSRTVCGLPLPAGLRECGKLPATLFTPSTKAALGTHDENISPARAAEIIGAPLARQMEELSLAIYAKAAAHAATRGILLADTKFEFGLDPAGQMVLADEVLTPDSSRFWPAAGYAPGRGQPSFDKQFVRDYLESIHFDKSTPVELPDGVIQGTLGKYLEAYRLITGADLAL
ncbi:MAG: phosphoribosylaminoimidazolesuccinocarboxamide synthase [Kiritimatiellia bacterium]